MRSEADISAYVLPVSGLFDSERCYRYQPQLNEENAVIAAWLLRSTDSQRNWGFGLYFFVSA